MQDVTEKKTRYCGIISVIGRPSVGKSTLLNLLCKHNACIVAQHPQSTRSLVRVIVTRGNAQIIFLDTPGYHNSETKYNQYLSSKVHAAMQDSDAILYLVDSTRPVGEEERAIASLLHRVKIPVLIAMTKLDMLETTHQQESSVTASFRSSKQYRFLSEQFPNAETLGISAKSNTGIEELLETLCSFLPEDNFHYPAELYTDQDVSFRISELVRAAASQFLSLELPHALDVRVIESQALSLDSKGVPRGIRVNAHIIVDSASQVGIVVGRQGSMLGKIRKAALKEIRSLFDYPVILKLTVRVQKNWRKKLK